MLFVPGLDTKIRDELKSLANKMERMKAEIPILKNIDQLKEEAMESAELLKEYKELYHLRSVGIKSQIGIVSAKYEKLKTFLQSDKYAKELSKREKQMRNHEKLIFESADFIASKVRCWLEACVEPAGVPGLRVRCLVLTSCVFCRVWKPIIYLCVIAACAPWVSSTR